MPDPKLTQAVAVARHGSFTRAAVAIGITQPAITRSVAELEKRVGFQLFNRTSNGAVLTVKGREFIERAARILEDERELMAEPLPQDRYAGVLRIGVCPASLEWLLALPLADLLRRHQTIRYEVTGGKFETIVQLLRTGAIDVAFGFEAAFQEWPDLVRHPVAAFRPALFVRAGHPLVSGKPIKIEDILAFDLISPSDSRPYGAVVRELYENRGIDWRKRVHVIDDFTIVRQIVASSDTIGVTALGPATQAVLAKRFVLLQEPRIFALGEMSCALRARWTPRAAARAFVDVMRRLLPPDA